MDYPCTVFDQPGLEPGHRPVGHLLGQISDLQEDTQIVGQGMKLQADLVLRHPFARQPCPVDHLFTLFDMLLSFTALVVKPDDPVWFHRLVGDSETDVGEQFSRMPLNLGDNTARLVP